ncbi:MAG: hypothetical protein AAF289_09485 [Cyanobacteria bacterium P01_A01_bin.135]
MTQSFSAAIASVIRAGWPITRLRNASLQHQSRKGSGRHSLRSLAWGTALLLALGAGPAIAEPEVDRSNEAAEALELDPTILEASPVLQRWLESTPDLLEDIHHDPAFLGRLRLGYRRSGDGEDGILASVEDVMLIRGLTLSADYRGDFEGDRYSTGGELRYYLLPLGRRVNLAPVVGYRALRADDGTIDGPALGLRLMLVPSRTGAADIAIAHTLVNPGGEEASIFTLSAGYALTQELRLGSDIQIETIEESTTQFAIALEWLL